MPTDRPPLSRSFSGPITRACPAYDYHPATRTYRPHRICPRCWPPPDPELALAAERSLARSMG